MGQSAIAAISTLFTIHKIAYINMGVTPMIGRNDHPLNIFTATDISVITQHVITNKIFFVSFWSFDRDRDCPAGEATPTCNNMGLNLGYQYFTNQFIQQLYVTGVSPCAINNGGCSPFATCSLSKGTTTPTRICRCATNYFGNGTFCSEWQISGCAGRPACFASALLDQQRAM